MYVPCQQNQIPLQTLVFCLEWNHYRPAGNDIEEAGIADAKKWHWKNVAETKAIWEKTLEREIERDQNLKMFKCKIGYIKKIVNCTGKEREEVCQQGN